MYALLKGFRKAINAPPFPLPLPLSSSSFLRGPFLILFIAECTVRRITWSQECHIPYVRDDTSILVTLNTISTYRQKGHDYIFLIIYIIKFGRKKILVFFQNLKVSSKIQKIKCSFDKFMQSTAALAFQPFLHNIFQSVPISICSAKKKSLKFVHIFIIILKKKNITKFFFFFFLDEKQINC